jgi:DNA primase
MTHPGSGGQDPPAQDPPGEAALRAVLADAATFYRTRLLEAGEPAVGLLRGRGLVDLAADTPAGLRWGFGYAADGTHPLLTHLRGLGHPDAVTVAAGLAAHTEHRGLVDVLRDRLVVPLRDSGGVVGFAGRRLSDPLADAAWVPPKWLNTATTALYRKSGHLYGLAEQSDLLATGTTGTVVLVEGPLDAVAVSLAGHVGLAAGGTALTPDHAAQLRAVTTTTRPLHVAYDGDPAGQAATVRAALLLAGEPAVEVFLAPGEDPASILNGRGPRGLRRALTATRPLVDAAVEARLATWDRHLDTANVAAAVDAARHVAPLIATAEPSEYARLIALVAAYTGLPAATVTGLVLDAVAPDPA